MGLFYVIIGAFGIDCGGLQIFMPEHLANLFNRHPSPECDGGRSVTDAVRMDVWNTGFFSYFSDYIFET